jgi:DNA-binding MarR family transcriptional regulator
VSGRTSREELIREVMAGFQRVSGHSVVLSQLIADKSDLSPADLETLGFLQQEGPSTAGRLAEVTGLTTGAVTRMIDRLERAKYVRRRGDPADRRRVLVELNTARVREFDQFYVPMTADTLKLLEGYSDRDLELVVRLLRDMYDFGVRHAERIRKLPPLPRRRRVRIEKKVLGQRIRVEM